MERKVRRPSRIPINTASIVRDSRDYPGVDRDIRTLVQRFKDLKPGQGLYPWSVTELGASTSARWLAKSN